MRWEQRARWLGVLGGLMVGLLQQDQTPAHGWAPARGHLHPWMAAALPLGPEARRMLSLRQESTSMGIAQMAPAYVLADLGGRCPDAYPIGLTMSPFGTAAALVRFGTEPALRCYLTADDARAALASVPPPPSGVPASSLVLYRDSLQYPQSGPAGIDSSAGSPGAWSVYWDWSELVLRSEDAGNQRWLIELAATPLDVALAVDAHLIDGVGNGLLTLACRWSAGHGYLFQVDPMTGHAAITRVDGADADGMVLAEVVEESLGALENWPATYEFSCASDVLSASINGQQILGATDATYQVAGAGFGVGPILTGVGTVAAKFHNLVLRTP